MKMMFLKSVKEKNNNVNSNLDLETVNVKSKHKCASGSNILIVALVPWSRNTTPITLRAAAVLKEHSH